MNPEPETIHEETIPEQVEFTPVTPPLPPSPVIAARRRNIWQRIWNNKFLFYSILAHLIFFFIATAFVVQTITAKRKLTFQGGPPSPNPSRRAIEHKVQMAQKQKTMSAPAQAKRITSTNSLAKVALPAMPAMPTSNAVTPSKMAGMGGTGVGLGPAIGVMGGSGSGGSGGSVPFFGLKTQAGGGSLEGSLYDLKQDRGRKPTDMTPAKYQEIVDGFVKNGWSEGRLSRFYKFPHKLYTTQIFIPDIDANEGPKAFGAEREVQPKMWFALYQGTVIPSESGTYYFVGNGDDELLVRFNGKTVLDACWAHGGNSPLAKKEGTYQYGWPITTPASAFIKGEAIHVDAGRSYKMEVLIGEQPGGKAHYCLLIEKQGETYQKDSKGNPILPIFRLADTKLPDKGNFPPHAPDGPVWKAEKSMFGGGGGLDIFKKDNPPAQ